MPLFSTPLRFATFFLISNQSVRNMSNLIKLVAMDHCDKCFDTIRVCQRLLKNTHFFVKSLFDKNIPIRCREREKSLLSFKLKIPLTFHQRL